MPLPLRLFNICLYPPWEPFLIHRFEALTLSHSSLHVLFVPGSLNDLERTFDFFCITVTMENPLHTVSLQSHLIKSPLLVQLTPLCITNYYILLLLLLRFCSIANVSYISTYCSLPFSLF